MALVFRRLCNRNVLGAHAQIGTGELVARLSFVFLIPLGVVQTLVAAKVSTSLSPWSWRSLVHPPLNGSIVRQTSLPMLRIHTWVFQAAITAVVLAGCGGAVGSRTCEYRASQPVLATFSLSVTLPDGGVQSCATLWSSDAGSGGPSPLGGEVSGWVTEVGGTAFSLDTCATGTGCSPEVYRFAIDSPDLTLTLPLGRRVTATWLFSSVVGRACPQVLVVNDGLPSDVASGTWSALWLAGADSTIQSPIPAPFSVVQQALSCNPNPSLTHPCGGPFPPDDYAFVFTPASGEPPLSLATGKTGTLALTTAPGLQQHLTVHNLRSYQTENCDDYWNWGWWAAGQVGASGQLE